ncbi:MAG: pyridoxal phosphate-dependent aminotransferase [Cellulomonadaceae bacterium]|nr:pyridoxal phosphate-dependent aminotransferase [Cellulomonadaceae bacterium]
MSNPPALPSTTASTSAAVARLMAGAPLAGEVDLSIGEPDTPLPPVLVDAAVASLRAGRTGYTPKLGLDELRVLVAQDVERQTGHLPATHDVVITVGGTGATAVALTVACLPADGSAGGIAVPDPAWPNYQVLAEQLGVPVHRWTQGASGDGFVDLPGVAAALDAGARLVVVNSPSNPTGAVASAEALRSLVELVRSRGAWLLSDEAYESVLASGGRAASPLAVGGADVTFVARTFSKTYSMTGLRVGALISPPAFRTAVAAVHGTTAGCAPITAQLVAVAALRDLPDRSAELAGVYGPRLERAREVLGPWVSDVGPTAELGGFYVWLDARQTGLPSVDVCAALRGRGVIVSAGTVYSAVEGTVRLALTAPDDVLDAALRTVRDVLDELSEVHGRH